MEINLLILLISFISLKLSFSLDFNEYYKTKTLDEVRHIIISLEKYLKKYDKTDSKQFSLFSMNRNDLTSYTQELIEQYGKGVFPTLESFNRTILIYPLKLSSDAIIKGGEKHNLVSWAFNAEKYDRKKNKTSDLIGGIDEYAHLLSSNALINYINETINRNNELKERKAFDKEILNIRYSIPNVIQLVRECSLEELKAFYYQLGIYLLKATGRDDGVDHEILINYEEKDQGSLLSKRVFEIIKANEELKDYDTFYHFIINKNTSYIHPEVIVDSMNNAKLTFLYKFVITCQEYHNRYHYSQDKQLKNLTDYLRKIPKRKIMKYILNEIKEFPELTLNNFKEEYKNNKVLRQLNHFFDNLFEKSRSELIQLYLNIQLVLNNTDKYNNNLGRLFRLKHFELIAIINEIISSKRPLALNYLIEKIHSIENESLLSFIGKYPRISLKYWYDALMKYRNSQENLLTQNTQKALSQAELIKGIGRLCTLHNITLIDIFREAIDKDMYSPLYGGIIDYLKAVKSKVLLTWLRQFEEFHRNQKKIMNIQGGCNDHHSNLTKIIIIDMIMTYLSLYPQFNNAIAFDQFTANRFSMFYAYRNDLPRLKIISTVVDGYRRRMNPLLNYGRLFNDYIIKAPLQKYKEKYTNAMMFFIFTVCTLHPELTINEVYARVSQEINYMNSPFEDFLFDQEMATLREFCLKIERYTNAINNESISNDFSDQTKVSLILYLKTNFKYNPQLKEKHNLFRLLNDQIDYLYWNIDSYLNRQNRISLVRIINSIDKHYNSKHKHNEYETELSADIKQMIKRNMTTVHPELKDYDLFDKVIDTISVNDYTIELYNKVKECNRNQLIILALTAEYLYWKNDKTNKYNSISSDLYTVTTKELIKYILYGREDDKIEKEFTYDELLIQSNALRLNHGDDNFINMLN